MTTALDHLDPVWAWSPFEPSAERPWDRSLAAHLYRRASFAGTWEELTAAQSLGPQGTLAKLFTPPAATAAFDRQMHDMARTVLATGDPERLSAWWLYRLVQTPDPVREKTTVFWHGHFATSAAKVEQPDLMYNQYQLLRRHAWGRFGDLVQEISRDPAMLIWLDSTSNRKTHPNENYARELLELFCLGVGNYTERDIQQIARSFTGWEVRRGSFFFSPQRHDEGNKTFFGRTGNFNGEDAVRIVLEQPAAPRFIARKLVRFYGCDEPSLPDRLLEPLAQQLRQDDFRIEPTLRMILASNFFYSPHCLAQKIRSPVELGVGLLRGLEGTANSYRLAEGTAELGQSLFFPPNVKGWDGGRTWINSSTLLGRINFVRSLLLDPENRFAGSRGLSALLARHQVQEPAALVTWLQELFLARPLPLAAAQALVELARNLPSGSPEQAAAVLQALAGNPEFQLV